MAAPLTTAPTSAPIESRRAQLAALRAQVRARHADRLPSAPAAELPSPVRASQAPRPRIRSSALWDQHCRRLSLDHEEQGQAQLLGSPPAAESDPGVYPTLGPNFIPEEETVRNDYAQNFVDTLCSDLPGGAVRNASLPGRFAEYPKLRRLVEAQQQLVRCHAHPPVYATADLRASLRRLPPPASADAPPPFHLGALLPVKYDVVLIDAPLETYHWEALPTARSVFPQRMPDGENERLRFPEDQFWSWEQLAGLPIPQLAAKESFVFLWVGTGAADGLERGRELLAKWGFRRCEDIVCVSTESDKAPQDNSVPDSAMRFNTSCLTRTIQHCLMGIRGTVRRSVDTNFVHCNIDTDVILWSPPRVDTTSQAPNSAGQTDKTPADLRVAHSIRQKMQAKPPELYSLIENFCQGTRRIELFGTNDNLRPGWLTVGLSVGPCAPGWPGPDPNQQLQSKPRTDEEVAAALEAGEGAGIPSNNPQSIPPASWQEPRPYVKAEYDSYFAVDPPGCELKDRSNVLPFDPVVDTLRPKSPPPRGVKSAPPPASLPHGVGSMPYPQSSAYGSAYPSPSAPSRGPRMRGLPPPIGGARLPPRPTFTSPANYAPPSGYSSPHIQGHHHAGLPQGYATPAPAGGAGLSGLGAGGARTVSVPSGSETLSGPQASVLGLRTPSALGAPHGLGRR